MNRESSIEQAWRVFLGGMVLTAAIFAVVLAYSAFFAGLTRHWELASAYLAMSGALSAGVAWLCYHRHDLVGLH